MEKEQIISIIKERILVKRLKCDDIEEGNLGYDELLKERLSLSSIDEFELILGIEDEFQLDLSGYQEEELSEHFSTINKMTLFIQKKFAAAAAGN